MANNFANLTSPQQLSVFDNVLGSTTSATQGAGAIGLNPALSYAPGTVGAALAGVNLGSISGADPTGSAYSDGAFATFLAACAGGKGVIPPGTWKLANSYNVPSGTTLEWMGSNAIIQYWGADAPLVVKSAKEIAFIRPNIDLTNAGSTAKAIPIRGGWFIDFYKPRVTFGNVGQSAWPISSSDVSSMGFGAYVINFFESDLTSGTGGFGISTIRSTISQTGTTTNASAVITAIPSTTGLIAGMGVTGSTMPAGAAILTVDSATQVTLVTGVGVTAGSGTALTFTDTVACTHLTVKSGWSSQVNYPLYLRGLSSFRIEGFTPENGIDGINLGGNVSSGFLSLGEMSGNSGYGYNFVDANCSDIDVIYPSGVGPGGALGLMNNTFYTPAMLLRNKLRMFGSGVNQNYWLQYESQYSDATSMVETVSAGSARVIRLYDNTLTSGHKLGYVASISSTSVMANNLRGSVTFAAGTTAAVTFPTAEPDANYHISWGVRGSNPGGFLWWSAPATSGFTMNCSASTSTTIEWVLTR